MHLDRTETFFYLTKPRASGVGAIVDQLELMETLQEAAKMKIAPLSRYHTFFRKNPPTLSEFRHQMQTLPGARRQRPPHPRDPCPARRLQDQLPVWMFPLLRQYRAYHDALVSTAQAMRDRLAHARTNTEVLPHPAAVLIVSRCDEWCRSFSHRSHCMHQGRKHIARTVVFEQKCGTAAWSVFRQQVRKVLPPSHLLACRDRRLVPGEIANGQNL